ncbi:PR domain zinc finger protein 13-like [Mya arenaria]|uniref:PR domain zinc finger protein 13-like n=1 Tax=Mya arenaria TaxID=6604 RepID=UPI0022E934D8|nr:PR domain zinc finger protein 13-like [Mya arenaria]
MDVADIILVAGSAIPAGASCAPLNSHFRFARTDEFASLDRKRYIEIVYVNGQMHSNDVSDSQWPLLLRPARDMFETNVQLCLSRDHNLHVRACRDIQQGEEIVCWYEAGLALKLEVPYLTAANIIGCEEYCCTVCEKSFRFPNFLKLHLMDGCKKSSSGSIVPGPPQGITYSGNGFETPGQPSKPLENELCTQVNLGSSSCHDVRRNLSKEWAAPKFTTKDRCFHIDHSKPAANLHSADTICEGDFEVYKRHKSEINSEDMNIEPLEILKRTFLNISTKDGHLCVYCGKVYSRKYGLKIHLRTHTGYKPLKCRHCLRPFGDPSNLNKHIRLHMRTTGSYRCNICGAMHVRRRDLSRHFRSRHPGYNEKDAV